MAWMKTGTRSCSQFGAPVHLGCRIAEEVRRVWRVSTAPPRSHAAKGLLDIRQGNDRRNPHPLWGRNIRADVALRLPRAVANTSGLWMLCWGANWREPCVVELPHTRKLRCPINHAADQAEGTDG